MNDVNIKISFFIVLAFILWNFCSHFDDYQSSSSLIVVAVIITAYHKKAVFCMLCATYCFWFLADICFTHFTSLILRFVIRLCVHCFMLHFHNKFLKTCNTKPYSLMSFFKGGIRGPIFDFNFDQILCLFQIRILTIRQSSNHTKTHNWFLCTNLKTYLPCLTTFCLSLARSNSVFLNEAKELRKGTF